MDTSELYENILFPFSTINNDNNSGNQVEINDNFYKNLSLNHCKVKNILEQIKALKFYRLNHDFINKIDLINNNISKNSLRYLNDDCLIEKKRRSS